MSNKESEQPVGDAQRKEEEQTVEDSPEGSVPEFRGDVTAKIKAGKYPRGYPDGRTVSVVSKQKGKTQRISVTISRGRPNRHGWEYQLVTAQGEPYQNGKWVDEDDIS